MAVKIHIPPVIQQYTNGKDEAEVTGSSVGQCLVDLARQFPGIEKGLYGKDGKLMNYIEVYVNLESSFPEELEKQVNDGDELHITVMLSGG